MRASQGPKIVPGPPFPAASTASCRSSTPPRPDSEDKRAVHRFIRPRQPTGRYGQQLGPVVKDRDPVEERDVWKFLAKLAVRFFDQCHEFIGGGRLQSVLHK